jgi:hypothetical protein
MPRYAILIAHVHRSVDKWVFCLARSLSPFEAQEFYLKACHALVAVTPWLCLQFRPMCAFQPPGRSRQLEAAIRGRESSDYPPALIHLRFCAEHSGVLSMSLLDLRTAQDTPRSVAFQQASPRGPLHVFCSERPQPRKSRHFFWERAFPLAHWLRCLLSYVQNP